MYIAIQLTRPRYCRSTVVTAYLSCLSSKGMVGFNGKIVLIQPEETLVKLYYIPLQQPEFTAANTITQ